MPHQTRTRHSAKSTADKARQWLNGGGVLREDSDDELGLVDHPWKWIYEKTPGETTEDDDSSDSEASDDDDDIAAALDALNQNNKRKRRATRDARQTKKITGARMGSFECHIGDCVLLKAEGTHEAWVAMICDFMKDDDGEKVAHFMWFSTEKEIRNKTKKRQDFMPNELYLTPSWDYNPLASINGKATILSPEKFHERYPDGKIPRGSRAAGKTFICRRGCNTRTATYTDEFRWEDVYSGREEDVEALVELITEGTKQTRKKRVEKRPKRKDEYELEVDSDDDDDEFLSTPRTPKKKRKTSALSTPQKVRTPSKLLTPSHKKVSVKKPLEFTPLGTRVLSVADVQGSPFQIARSRLHVSSVPEALPCREAEFDEVYSHLEAAISDGSGACIYISGTPGTGKTATVREVVARLNLSVAAEELDDFIFVEINGMKVTDPHQSYSLLWEALKGDRVSPTHALNLLEREFNFPSPRRVPCVVLMDELDQLVTKNQSVMYNFFNWPSLRHSRLIVLAVANTMDLPERTLSNKISSRLGLTRITFPGYNHEQLMKIIQARLEGIPGGIVDPDAVQFASRKVAAVSGDARRALDICRRAVELAETEAEEDDTGITAPGTPSKKARAAEDAGGDPTGTPSKTPGRPSTTRGRVTIATVKRAITEATTSPLQQHLRALPLASKILLAAVLNRTRRTGVAESLMGDILDEAKRIVQMASKPDVSQFLLAEIVPAKRGPWVQQPVAAPRLSSMATAAVELMEAGVVGLEMKKGDRTGKIRLSIGDEDIKLAFRDDPDMKDMNFTV